MSDIDQATRETAHGLGAPPPATPGPFESYRAPNRPTAERFAPGGPEAVLAICLGVFGFVYWDWHVPIASLGACLFYLGCLAAAWVYFARTGVRQNVRSLVLLAVAVFGALRFALMDFRDIDLFAQAVQAGLSLLWVAYSCRTTSSRWDAFVLADWFNQTFVVPFANLGRWFQSLGWAIRSRRRLKVIVFPLVGVVVCVPVFFIVMTLLAASDDSFSEFLSGIANWFAHLDFDLGRYIVELIVGVPVAAYVCGAVVGNRRRLHVSADTKGRAEAAIKMAHVVNRAVVYGPLGVLAAIYSCYFLAMGSYVFSAMAGVLPGGFSYAQYARRGFFELCGVATINLCALVVAYLLARRNPKEYPRPLRALCAALSAFTCLLVVTAMSKLALYIGTYGLSQLRLYAAWFLILLLGVFVTVVVWHVRPFNAGRPIAWIVTAMAAAICVANTDGIIAGYNVQRYQEGQANIDVAMVATLNDAAVPALEELAAHAPDPQVRADAADAVRNRAAIRAYDSFADWNLQSWLATRS